MQKLSDVIGKANRECPPNDDFARAHYLFQWMCCEAVVSDYNAAIDLLTQAPIALSTTNDADYPITTFILAVQIGRTTFSSAYGRLCALAGIDCQQICGSLRGVGLRSLNHHSSKRQNSITAALMATHSWSLLKLGEHRQVLVCSQCAVQRAAPIEVDESDLNKVRRLKSSEDTQAVIDDFYFGTDPEIFAYTHYPTDSSISDTCSISSNNSSERFQLLDRPFTQNDFYTSPLVTSAFYALGLDFADSSRRSSFVVSDAKEFQLHLLWRNEADAKRAAEFREFRFLFVATDPITGERLKDEDMPAVSKSASLADYCLFEISDRGLSYSLRFPENGFYRFVAFASSERNEIGQQIRRQQANMPPSEAGKVYRARKSSSYLVPASSTLVPLCEWLIEVDRPPIKEAPTPFPKCQAAQQWGLPATFGNRYGVSNALGRFGARIVTEDNGVGELYMKLTKPCIFSAKLKRFDEVNPPGANIFHRIVKNIAVFTVCIPLEDEPTEMGLEIFANDPSCDGKTLYGFAQFLVSGPAKPLGDFEDYCSKQLTLLPALNSNILGQHTSCAEVGLHPLTHSDPLIAVNSSKELEVRFTTSEGPLRLIVGLYLCKSVTNNQISTQDFSLYTLHQTISPTTLAVICRFPHKGVYKLQLFAAKAGTHSDLPVVCTYAIFVNAKTASCVPFPKQLSAWNGGFLFEPRYGVLEKAVTGKTTGVTFKLALPQARKVAVVVRVQPKERIILLNKILQPDGSSYWEGALPFESTLNRTEIAVMANLINEQDEASYSTLLIYNNQEMFQLSN